MLLNLEETLTRPALLAPILLVVGYVLYQLFRPSGLPDIPIVGARPGEWFPLARARWRNTKDMKTATEIAYTQYRDRACILPVAGAGDFVMLPSKETQWLVDQPDSDIDLHQQASNALQLDYTVTDPRLVHNPVHQKLISGVLTRETGNLVPDLLDETRASVDSLWGTDTDSFREICVYDVMRRIIGQATNRVFVGLPLCRDQALLEAGMSYAQDVPLGSTILRFIPWLLRPLAAPLITLPGHIHTRRFYAILRPEVERRLRDYDARRRAEDPEKTREEEPNDFLQWCVHQAKASGDPYMYRADTLSGRILLLNFASIHTSSFAITHAILDLACAAPGVGPGFLAELRAEITGALREHGGDGVGVEVWNKRALAAMEKLDSVMRESQRVNSFVTVGTSRLVVREGGVLTPGGVRVPRGAVVCTPSYPVFHDPEVYPDPYDFKPFRFAEKRAAGPCAAEGQNGNGNGNGVMKGEEKEKSSSSSYVQRARQAFATTSHDYLAFGHGRHACPGRFFAASELKLMLAYIVMNYDFDFETSRGRPENFWFGMNRIPPMKATIRVRRRRETGL
ncbi:cytochrome P450 [Hypoxylon sp. NC1633]|nr:cytochrome P450 [Hypoxylon sp. NC1633]